ncbi:g7261 [Coccomyxa elongata]
MESNFFRSSRRRPAGLSSAKEPIEARVLSSFLNLTSVPYSSYVPSPKTFLHDIHAALKQLWLLVLLMVMARASATARLSLSLGLAAITAAALPRKLWQPQLRRLGMLGLIIFIFTAIGADGVPPVLQTRGVPPAAEGLPSSVSTPGSYRYVLFHFWFITITRRSLSLAVAASCLTFVALQSASLSLTTTPAEEMTLGLRLWLAPLRLLRMPVDEIALTLLLSLRFMALVTEEMRNLSLGLAARAVPWKRLPPGGGVQVLLRLGGRLFSNLMQRSENIALAMQARDFAGPVRHHVHLAAKEHVPLIPNIMAVLLLSAVVVGGQQFRLFT